MQTTQILTGLQFASLVETSLAPCASPQVREGQTEVDAQAARRKATAITIRRTYGEADLPFHPLPLGGAYRRASDAVALPPVGDKTFHGIAGRKETARHLADLLDSGVQYQAAGPGALADSIAREVAAWWRTRAAEIETEADPAYPAQQTAAVVATLRREADAIDPAAQ